MYIINWSDKLKNFKNGKLSSIILALILLFFYGNSNVIAGSDDVNDLSSPEVGVEWVNAYSWPYSSLTMCDDSANGLYNKLSSKGWVTRFNYGDANAKAFHFEQGSDASYVDNCDIAFYSGHGGTNVLSISTYWEKVYNNEAEWGEVDLEWIGLDCCRAGTGDFGSSLNGIHLILGFYSESFDSALGAQWAEYLISDSGNDPACTVLNSWFWAVEATQPDGTQARVLGETDNCGSDYLWGQGSVISDPPVDGTMVYWDYTK